MQRRHQPYQQANSNSIFSLFKIKNILLILCTVNISFIGSICNAQDTTFYYKNGNISSEGYLQDGKPNGYWKTYSEKGILKSEGNRKNFELDSNWVFYTENGKKANTIAFTNGYKNGPSITYDTNENVVENVLFENNIRQGLAQYYYGSGVVKLTENYVDDRVEGLSYEYDSTGRIITIREYTQGFLRNKSEINRYDKNGKKTGLWKEFYADGIVKWEGKYLNGQLEGVVKEYDSKGTLLTIEKYNEGELNVEDNNEVEFFELQKEIRSDGSMLVGGYADGKKQGVFREYNDNGELLASYKYKNDLKLAEGMLDSSGLKDGEWVYYYETGQLQARGNYQNGVKLEEWNYYYKNGKEQQKGVFKNGQFHGLWKWWYSNGQLHREESFRKGKEDGEVIEYDTLGNVLTHGEFIDGIREGRWNYNVNDHTEEGEYRDGEKHGVWTFKYKDNKIAFKGEYINGLPIGKHKYYYPGEKLQWEGKYENGFKEGEWKKYTEEGEVDLRIIYKRGEEYKINGFKLKL